MLITIPTNPTRVRIVPTTMPILAMYIFAFSVITFIIALSEKRPSAIITTTKGHKVLIKQHVNCGCGGLTPHLPVSLGTVSTPSAVVDS